MRVSHELAGSLIVHHFTFHKNTAFQYLRGCGYEILVRQILYEQCGTIMTCKCDEEAQLVVYDSICRHVDLSSNCQTDAIKMSHSVTTIAVWSLQ